MAPEPAFPAPPFSDLASPEAAIQFEEGGAANEALARAMAAAGDAPPIDVVRALVDEHLLRPGLVRLLDVFDVTIESREIAGVRTDVVRPAAGVAPENADRVLLNLHGGGLTVAGGVGGQQESVPIAALGGIEVISVDYRMHPEYAYPAASEDVAAVYEALLERYDPANIGIYGCSAGGYLTAACMPWFERAGLPRPGAIGVFSAPAAIEPVTRWGDSWQAAAFFRGHVAGRASEEIYFRPEDDWSDPLISPVLHPDVLARYPSTLLVSGTRDLALSRVVDLHAKLVAARVDARLHIWEGAEHCSFAQGIVDPFAPETRQAWDVMVSFFAERLGFTPPSPEEDS
jgi:monoterpene epsilon-lactone hydrolase